ncbi:MAG: TIR domain-containing protein [Lachnospiraceae bacterium]|nr:TIR domain-containing protein [Lachnospiraceae bacterium]
MARLIGKKPASFSLSVVYDFVMTKLPDYIYAVFEPVFETADGQSTACDMILFIPHMGVFILDVCDAVAISSENGQFFFSYRDGRKTVWDPERLADKRVHVQRFLKERFRIAPLVYEIQCFPSFRGNPGMLSAIDLRLGADHALFFEDLLDETSFLVKLYRSCIHRGLGGIQNGTCEDLTDVEAHSIFFYWESGVPAPMRPQSPPLVFLSYNRFNQVRAREIKEELENNGIFVWRAPEDVPVGTDYYVQEMDAIEKCDAFLILLSSTSQESEEVRKEFVKAVNENKKIIPIWIEDCSVNTFYSENLTRHQYRYMIDNDMDVMNEIIRVVKEGHTP